jgi:hypothetical protein
MTGSLPLFGLDSEELMEAISASPSFIGDIRSMKVHHHDCPLLVIVDERYRDEFEDVKDALAVGYEAAPCLCAQVCG